jgi:hypothetical protein
MAFAEEMVGVVGRKLPERSSSVSVTSIDGQAVLVPSSAAHLGDVQTALLSELQHAALAARRAREELDALANAGRAGGLSWPLVAWSTGMSVEGAKSRWGRGR